MTKPKQPTKQASVTEFLANIANDVQRADMHTLVEMLRTATKAEPKLWQGAIVGFGAYHYVDPNGREGDWLLVGVSPRKGLTLYILGGWEHDAELLAQLGKHTLGNGYLLHLKQLADVNLPVLKKLLVNSLKQAKKLAQAQAKQPA